MVVLTSVYEETAGAAFSGSGSSWWTHFSTIAEEHRNTYEFIYKTVTVRRLFVDGHVVLYQSLDEIVFLSGLH